jgi:hypothetical protein
MEWPTTAFQNGPGGNILYPAVFPVTFTIVELSGAISILRSALTETFTGL